jgi:hypothetical protein
LSKKNENLSDVLSSDGPIKPARNVAHRSTHRSVGILACSWIQGHAIEYESQLERRFLLQALVIPMVQSINHQPFRLEYLEDGKIHTYVPDFFIRLKDGAKVVIEIKPRRFLKSHHHKLAEAERILAERNVHFLVVTDKEIDDGIKFENASFLLRFARGSASEKCKQRCLVALGESSDGLRIEELMQRADVSETDILHFIGRRELSIDLSEPISQATAVHLPKNEHHDYLHFLNWFNTSPGHAIAGIQENAE